MTILSLVPFFSLAVSGAMASDITYRTAIAELAQFDLGSISSRDAANWVVIRILPDESSGAILGPGVVVSKTGQLIPKGDRDQGVIAKGEWELIAPLVPDPNVTPKGTYDWLGQGAMHEATAFPFDPFWSGGTLLAEHFPDKKGANQFGRTVVLPADMGKWIPAAYEFRQKNAKIFGEEPEERALIELLHDKNPMIAVMAAQRLARGRRLSSEATDAMLDGPADFRRALAFYLRLVPFGSEPRPVNIAPMRREEPPKGDSWVTPGMKAAIEKADGAMLRCYGLATIQSRQTNGSAEENWPAYAPLIKLCRERAGALIKLNRELREDLDFLMKGQ